MKHDKMKFGVGLFVLIFLLNIALITYYILDKKGIFDKRYQYNFIIFDAEPFSIGMPIKVSGFKIGYIEQITLKDNGSVEVMFSVNEENRKWVLQQSVIMIRKPLLGSTQVILYPAIDNPLVKEGGYLEVFQSSDINEVIYKLKPIVVKLENIVTSVDKITSYLARDDSELVNIVKNLESFSSSLVQNKSILTTITGDQKATDSLINTINRLPELMDNFNKLSADLHGEVVPQTIEFIQELSQIAQDVKMKLEKLNGVVDSVSSYDNELIDLKENIQVGIKKSNEILEKVDNILPGEKPSSVVLP